MKLSQLSIQLSLATSGGSCLSSPLGYGPIGVTPQSVGILHGQEVANAELKVLERYLPFCWLLASSH